MTTHTPTPWVTGDRFSNALAIYGGPGAEAYARNEAVEGHSTQQVIGWAYPDEADKANAEFIVKAVNSHADLLEALKACEPLLLLSAHEYRERNDQVALQRYLATAELARVAIAAAS